MHWQPKAQAQPHLEQLNHYGWLRRYQADGLDGLKDRSQRPHHSPRATKAKVVEKIIWLRQLYHFGPAKIAMYLARYHDVTSVLLGCGGSRNASD